MCPDSLILSAYLDGEVPEKWAKEIGKHISTCAVCRVRMADFHTVTRSLREEKDPDFHEVMSRVWHRLEIYHKNRGDDLVPFWKRRIPVPIPMLATAAVLVLILAFTLGFNTVQSIAGKSAERKPAYSENEVSLSVDIQDFEKILRFLEQQDSIKPNVIYLPVLPKNSEFFKGEPAILRAADFKLRQP